MRFKVPRFRGGARPEGIDDVAELVALIRRQAAAVPDSDALRGQIAGAESRERPMLPVDPAGGSRKFLAGFLAGHLEAHVIRTQGRLISGHIIPLAAYAAALVSPQAERHLTEAPPLNLLKAHALACLVASERGDLPLAAEEVAFGWLAEQLAILRSADLDLRFAEWHERRLASLAATASGSAGDGETGAAARTRRQLDALATSLERQLATVDPASPEADRLRGARDGLQAEVGLLAGGHGGADRSESYRGGLLGGSLVGALIGDGRTADETLRRHGFRYGAVLASPAGTGLLAEPPPANVLKAHQLAIHTLAERSGEAIAEDLDVAMLRWLGAQAGLAVTPELEAQRVRHVVRRKPPAS